jgi:hypothetical protein
VQKEGVRNKLYAEFLRQIVVLVPDKKNHYGGRDFYHHLLHGKVL